MLDVTAETTDGFYWTAPLIWSAPPFSHLTILACVAALSPCARVPMAFPAHYKSAATHAKVTECGTGRRTPNRGSEPKLTHYPLLSTGSIVRAIMLSLTLQNPMVDSEESMQKGRD